MSAMSQKGSVEESRPALLSKPLVRRLASVVDRVIRARLGAVGQRPQEIGQLGVPISLIKARALAYLSSASACSDFDGPDAPASRWPHRTPGGLPLTLAALHSDFDELTIGRNQLWKIGRIDAESDGACGAWLSCDEAGLFER